jgi:ferredoxin
MPTVLTDIERAVTPLGMIVRGGFHPTSADAVPGAEPGEATLVLIGNAGSTMWEPFDRAWPAARREHERHPLNTWTREVVSPIAAGLGGRALYPMDGPPYLPFQRWGAKAEGLRHSPLGTLLHPVYGQWHAYRAALVFGYRVAIAVPQPTPDPCADCQDKPCLSSCPVHAFRIQGYEVATCVEHLAGSTGRKGGDCMERGCLARRACPVGCDHLYRPPHARFHMGRFLLSHRDVAD